MSSDKKYLIDQHLNTNLHKENAKRKQNTLRQLFLTEQQPVVDNFNFEMCEALLSANIPWTKIENTKLRQFLEKYCNRTIPNESTLRKNYLNKCYDLVSLIKRDLLCFNYNLNSAANSTNSE